MKRITGWKTKGMNRDISVSAFNNEFSFENINLRIITNEGNTALSWVNEKGTAQIALVDSNNETVTISGTPIGTAVLNRTLVLFTTGNTSETHEASKTDYIYKLSYKDADKTVMEVKNLFQGNLNFSTLYPLETMVSYEAEHIQKVYWVDGRNQPRIINIANETKLAEWNNSATESVSTYFDFVPSINLKENVTITRGDTGGEMFAPGVIQYCFTYVNKYGQQTNIAWVSPLYYLTHSDRGASPEEEVVNSFIIDITGADTSFDYLRLYSIQRTSIDDVPFVKMLDDIPISQSISYIDNGTAGHTVDPTELLYVGGREIIANTLTDKDNTLFIGNFSQKNASMVAVQQYFNSIRNTQSEMSISFNNNIKEIDYGTLHSGSNDTYISSNTLTKGSRRSITSFKGGEYYRFGFQLQKNTGEWSDPVFMNDELNTVYPSMTIERTQGSTEGTLKAYLVHAQANINLSAIYNRLPNLYSAYKKIRPVVVYPTVGERAVLCQGVVNPTVFNIADRIDNSPFAQSSWYFRPYMVNLTDDKQDDVVTSPASAIQYNVSYQSVTEYNEDSNAFLLDPNGLNLGNSALTSYSIFICNIPQKYRGEIFSRKYLKYKQFIYAEKRFDNGSFEIITTDYPELGYNYDNAPYDKKCYFDMALFIGNMAGQPFGGDACLLFSRNSFPTPYDIHGEHRDDGADFSVFEVRKLEYYSPEVSFYKTPADTNKGYSFKIYSGIKDTDGMLYYTNPSSDEEYDTYIFQVYYEYMQNDNPVGYGIQIRLEGTGEGYSIIKNNKTGNGVAFTHYESLPTQTGIWPSNGGVAVGTIYNQRSSIEIQGSNCNWASMYGRSANNSNLPSNTQFVVDQSIITMHSPDIEFDTEVQNYSMENLKMRIVGAIPITSNASAHRITTSSTSLETSHNNDTISSKFFGTGETNNNIVHKNVDLYAGQRLVADYLWNDSYYISDTSKEDKCTTAESTYNFLVFPWHRNGSLNNDPRQDDVAASMLRTKKESNILYSLYSNYFDYPLSSSDIDKQVFEDISAQMHLTENDFIINLRLPRQKNSTSEINYYPNVDKVLYNTKGYEAYVKEVENLPNFGGESSNVSIVTLNNPVSMKYKSTSHAVIALNGSMIPILPRGYKADGSAVGLWTNPSDPGNVYQTIWGDTGVRFTQKTLDERNLFLDGETFNFLWLAELYKDVEHRFGGDSEYALKNNKWVQGGEAVDLMNGNNPKTSVSLIWTEGDTFFQRYDHLKTYAFTEDDTNQIVEILSFMCESRVNIDGRYDRNRGQMNNTLMRPGIFNLLNPVYTQRDNFFTQRTVNTDDVDTLTYPNQITYSKTKISGADVDLYTNVTLGSTMELDGDKGSLNKLMRFNDQIIAFQDTGISQILYNENVQIASTAGVPIEIANSGKVQGKRYLSDSVGCSNKWSMVSTPYGIYFMNSHDKSMYLFNGQLTNLSVQGGMNSWSKKNIPDPEIKWTPDGFGNYRSFYDKVSQDIFFVGNTTTLAFSEKVNAFTSFYDYQDTPFFNNLDNTGVWIRKDGSIWKHNAGDYCKFFGVNKPYSITLIGNPEPTTDKIFTNIEFRATIDGDGTYNQETDSFVPALPFDYLETWDEYQHGIATLSHRNGHSAALHHTADNTASLNRKFRMWRCDIPRDNAPLESDTNKNITRFKTRPTDRMRNPWLYLKLQKEAAAEGSLSRAELHDFIMTYFS